MTRRVRAFLVAAPLLALLVVGCCSKPPASPVHGTCKDPEKPYVVEWTSDQRSQLERAAPSGVLVVRYEGCKLELLPRCSVATKYRWERVTPKRDRIAITNSDELWLNVPIGAAHLEGTLHQAGELTIDTLRVGAWNAPGRVDAGSLQGECTRATHVVSLIAIGAFEMFAGSGLHVQGGAGVPGIGGGGYDKKSSTKTLTQDGAFDACKGANPSGPPTDCAALIRLELSKIGLATHTCRPDDELDCRAQCNNHNDVSCQRLAAFLSEREGPKKEAAGLWKQACDAGNARACNNYGVLLVRGEEMTHDLVRSRAVFSKACDDGVMEACSNAGMVLNADEYGADRRSDPAADPRFRRACAANIGVACFYAGSRHDESGQRLIAPDAMALLTKACDLRYRFGCRELWMLYRQSNPARANEMKQRACEYGFRGACGEGEAIAEDPFRDLLFVPPP